MREAIGGALLIKLVLFFIVLYVAILSIAINYSTTFRVKNQIINLIEQYEGYANAEASINNYIDSIGFYKSSSFVGKDDIENSNSCNVGNGYKICQIKADTVVSGSYYKVITYVKFDLPIIGDFIGFPISGETRIIYD